jgi:DNA replication protein DnaC
MPVLEPDRCEWIVRRENVIALGPSGPGKTHVTLGHGPSACQNAMRCPKLLILDKLGFVPRSKTVLELLFELISQRDAREGPC